MRNEAVRLQAIAPDFDGMAAKAKEASGVPQGAGTKAA